MTINELHQDLIEAYSVNNLNTISLTLINLFKNQQFSALQKISEMISDCVQIPDTNDAKGFHKLMMLYHPDRAGYHINEINMLKEQDNFNGLVKYSHILKLERIGELATTFDSYEDIDYNPVYEWDISEDGFNIVDDQSDDTEKMNTEFVGYSFYDAVRLREFADFAEELPVSFLMNADDVELSSCNIIDLDGIQFCTHAITLDLSNNRISDLLPLAGLRNLEELNLSNNEIGFIDDLIYLRELRSINVSYNYIDDISPLFELENLEYVDLTGNRISMEQINQLNESGISVDF